MVGVRTRHLIIGRVRLYVLIVQLGKILVCELSSEVDAKIGMGLIIFICRTAE